MGPVGAGGKTRESDVGHSLEKILKLFELFMYMYAFVYMYMGTCVCVKEHIHTCAHVCGGKRLLLGINLHHSSLDPLSPW